MQGKIIALESVRSTLLRTRPVTATSCLFWMFVRGYFYIYAYKSEYTVFVWVWRRKTEGGATGWVPGLGDWLCRGHAWLDVPELGRWTGRYRGVVSDATSDEAKQSADDARRVGWLGDSGVECVSPPPRAVSAMNPRGCRRPRLCVARYMRGCSRTRCARYSSR
jgi:hypothetical protein